MALLTGKSRTVAVRAMVNTNLWALYRTDFDGLLVKMPALAMALSRALRERLSQSARSTVPAHLHTLAVAGDLSRIQLEELAERLTAQSFRRGDVVYHEGRLGDAMYFIESGRVDLVARGAQGSVLLQTLQNGDFFGETALLTGMPYNATAHMAADGTLWALRKPEFDSLLFKYPNLAVVLSRVLSERQICGHGQVARGGWFTRAVERNPTGSRLSAEHCTCAGALRTARRAICAAASVHCTAAPGQVAAGATPIRAEGRTAATGGCARGCSRAATRTATTSGAGRSADCGACRAPGAAAR